MKLTSRLPRLDEIKRVDKHNDVEQEIVTDNRANKQLQAQAESNCAPEGQTRCGEKADYHCDNVTHGIDDAVAKVIERDRCLAVTIDDEIRVLKNFPGAFDYNGKAKPDSERPFPADKPEQAVEEEAMDTWDGVYQSLRC